MVLQASPWFVVARAVGEEAPATQPAPPAAPDVMHLSVSELYVDFETDYEYRRVKYELPWPRDSRQENRDLRLTEALGMTLAGDVYDPNLIDFQAGLEFGLSQARFIQEVDRYDQTESDSGYLLDYDVTVDALKNKPVSFHAYARRFDNRIPRRFLPSLREKQTETGVSMLAVHGPFTTEAGFSFADIDRYDNRLKEDDESRRLSRFYLEHEWAISDDQQLKLSYDHAREDNTYQGSRYDFDLQRDEVRIDHNLAFGPQKKHQLDTYFRYNAEIGDLARDELELVPRLTLQHSDKFRTDYRYSLYRVDQAALTTTQQKFDVEALYTPTDEWRITLDAFALYEDVEDDSKTYEVGGGSDVQYTHPTSLGELSANLMLGYVRSCTSGELSRRVIFNEAHQLGGPVPAYLDKVGAVPISIVAHNATRTRFYLPGLDYFVSVHDGRVRIHWIPTGRIDLWELVYFDYAYRVPTDSAVNTYRTDLQLEHRFEFGLIPYYYFEGRFQEGGSDWDRFWQRDNMDRHRLGARFERERWNVGAELEIFDDSVEPYNAVHFTGQYGLLRSPTHTLDLSGELSRYCFEGGVDERDVWWFDGELSDRLQLNRYFSLTTSAAYRWEDNDVDGNKDGVDVECGIQFARGDLLVELTVEYDLLSFAQSREDGFGIFLNVRRDLTNLLPRPGAKP